MSQKDVKIFLIFIIFYFLKKTNRSLEKQLESFNPFDSFEFLHSKHNYAVVFHDLMSIIN